MYRIFLFLCVILVSFVCKAQDRIIKTSGENILVKITGSNKYNVRYYINNDKTLYLLSKDDIYKIIYQNGKEEIVTNIYKESDVLKSQSNIIPNYSILKNKYKHKLLSAKDITKTYSPITMGISSLLITGMGQILCGEQGRGFNQLLGNIAISSTFILLSAISSFIFIPQVAIAFSVLSIISPIFINILSMIDAINIAKIKNLYYYYEN